MSNEQKVTSNEQKVKSNEQQAKSNEQKVQPHACDTNPDEVLMRLEHDTALTVCWFESNGI